MTILLILILIGPSGRVEVPWAQLADPAACAITGGALAEFLQAQAPQITVRYRCQPLVAA